VAEYYDVPVVSMRHALHRLQSLNASGYTSQEMRANSVNRFLFHLNELGSKYLADLVMEALERVVAAGVAHAAAPPAERELDALLNARDQLPGMAQHHTQVCGQARTQHARV
jgi:hypothetical protein